MRTCRWCRKRFDETGLPPACTARTTETDVTTCEPVARGFAAMSAERRAEVAAMGGRRSHENGSAHRFTSETARVAGQAGGVAPHRQRGPGKKQRQVAQEV